MRWYIAVSKENGYGLLGKDTVKWWYTWAREYEMHRILYRQKREKNHRGRGIQLCSSNPDAGEKKRRTKTPEEVLAMHRRQVDWKQAEGHEPEVVRWKAVTAGNGIDLGPRETLRSDGWAEDCYVMLYVMGPLNEERSSAKNKWALADSSRISGF